MTKFKPYDMGNSEAELHARTGEAVTLVGDVFVADLGNNILMQRVRFEDGAEVDVFLDEIVGG